MLLVNYGVDYPPAIEYILKSLESKKCYYYCYATIDDNHFVSNEDKIKIKSYIERNSKYRNLCRKFIINCKKSIVKTRDSINNIDLLFNNINEIPINEKVNLYENGKVYVFSKDDIISIFTTALMDCVDGWPMPKVPKNPYTNIDFTNEQISILSNSIDKKPVVMQLYEEYKFNIDEMKSYHLNYFKKNAIDEDYKYMENDERDIIIDTLIKNFTHHRLNKDNLENYRKKFNGLIKDFKLLTNCDSKYLKNYLFNDMKKKVIDICMEFPLLVAFPKEQKRKYLRAKRIKK